MPDYTMRTTTEPADMTSIEQSPTGIQPFYIAIPQADLDDLRGRLARTRWPDEVDGVGWSMGTNLCYMKELADYWQHEYDWRTHEAALNQLPQFKADVDGIGIHFVHVTGHGKRNSAAHRRQPLRSSRAKRSSPANGRSGA